jgi:hypothetical protein
MINHALIPTKEEFDILKEISKYASDSKHFDKIIGGQSGLFSIALYAKEMGIPPMTALHGGLMVVQGKVTMSAEMMNSMIRKAGHKIEILKSDLSICSIKGTRKDNGEHCIVTFTIEDARKAQLIKAGGAWDKHPDDMLFARCISKLKRRLFPDVCTKAYVEGEIEEVENENTNKPIEHSKTIEVASIENKAPEPIVEYFSKEQIEEIESLILPEESEYKKDLFGFFTGKHGKLIDSFENMPKVYFESCLKVAKKRADSRKPKESEMENG